jgi:hypothetical protein
MAHDDAAGRDAHTKRVSTMGLESTWLRALVTASVLGGVGLAGGCKSGGEGETPPATRGSAGAAAQSAGATTASAPALGDSAKAGAPEDVGQRYLSMAGEGLLTIVLRPKAWPDLQTAILKLLSAAPEETKAELAMAGSLAGLLVSEKLIPFDGLGLTAETFAAAALDRPWIISLFAPPDFTPVPGAPAAAWLSGTRSTFTHSMVIPSKDAKALAAAFGTAFATSGTAEPAAKGVPAWRYAAQRMRLAVLTGSGHVQLIVQTGTLPPPDATWLPGTTAVNVGTEGDRWVLGTSAAVAVRLRNRHLRGVSAWLGLGQLGEALEQVDDVELKPMMRAAGLGIALSAEVVMGAPQTDFEEQVLALAGEVDGIRITTASTYGGDFGAALSKAAAVAAPAFPYAGAAPAISGGLALDLAELLKSRTAPSWFQPSPSPRQLRQMFSDCGFGCPLYGLFHAPFSLLKGANQLAATRLDSFEPLPRVLLASLVPDAKGQPAIAVATAFGAGAPPPPSLVKALSDAGTFTVSQRAELPVAQLLSGIVEAYDMAGETEAPALLWLDLDRTEISKFFPGELAMVAAAFAGVEGVHLRFRHTAAALVGDGMVAATGTNWTPRTVSPSGPSSTLETGHAGKAVSAATVACAHRTATHFARLLSVARNASPDQVARLMYPEAQALKPALACLAADPATAVMVPPLREDIRARLTAASPGEALPDDVP